MMIDAEMYGMIPSAKILMRSSAPPENMLKRLRMVPSFCRNSAAKRSGLMPGTGMCAPIR